MLASSPGSARGERRREQSSEVASAAPGSAGGRAHLSREAGRHLSRAHPPAAGPPCSPVSGQTGCVAGTLCLLGLALRPHTVLILPTLRLVVPPPLAFSSVCSQRARALQVTRQLSNPGLESLSVVQGCLWPHFASRST